MFYYNLIMEVIKDFFKIIADVVDIIGIIILIYGFIKQLIKYIGIEFLHHPFKTSIKALQKIRCEIGIYILLALDFLIASDIIHSIMDVSQKELIELGVMIGLRIAIGYFLGKEIKEIHND